MTINGISRTGVRNAANSQIVRTSAAGRTSTINFNPNTNLKTSISKPGLQDVVYGYDARGRRTSTTQGARVTTKTFNAQGFVASVTDPLQQTTSYAYDPVGRTTSITRADGTIVGFSYDLCGNNTRLTNAANNQHNFEYNNRNLLSYYTTPLNHRYSYQYNQDGKLTRTDYPSGKWISNTYGHVRLLQTQTSEGETISRTYLNRRISSITRGNESLNYTWDGHLLTGLDSNGTMNRSLAYVYDNNFRRTGFTYAGATEANTYDNDGLLVGSGLFTITRDSGNGLPQAVAGGALSLSRTFNTFGELAGQQFTVQGANPQGWTLGRDNSGRIISKTETVDGASNNYTYTYDPLGRLRTVTLDGVLVEEHRYDLAGNRTWEMNTRRGISGRVYEFDAEDRLTRAGSRDYQYDADGYLTRETTSGGSVTQYSYSALGELKRVDLPSGTFIEYVYDPLGRRVAKKVNGLITEKYLWEGKTRLLAVYDGNNNRTMRFRYADDRMPLNMNKNGTSYYLGYEPGGVPAYRQQFRGRGCEKSGLRFLR